jgi:uncharacterized protein YjbJ (UPF0337 family)
VHHDAALRRRLRLGRRLRLRFAEDGVVDAAETTHVYSIFDMVAGQAPGAVQGSTLQSNPSPESVTRSPNGAAGAEADQSPRVAPVAGPEQPVLFSPAISNEWNVRPPTPVLAHVKNGDRQMGEFTDKMKGAANQAAGSVKQNSRNERVREEGAAQEVKGNAQELKGKVKGVINKL